MLVFIVFTTIFWSTTSSEKLKFAIPDHNVTELEILFKQKYMSKGVGYTKWQKLHDAQPVDLISVCTKFALMLSKDESHPVKAEGKAGFQDKYTLLGCEEPVELDTITCLVKFFNQKAKQVGKMKYFLAEGDEPDSAFRFSLLQTTMVLTRKIKNIWSRK